MSIEQKPFKINGVAIATPTEYEASIEDLSSEQTGRTLDGVMHKDVVAVKDYYKCTWKILSWEDIATILNAIDGKPSFELTYADPRVPGRFITNTFYVGERTSPALNLKDEEKTWKNLSLKFIRI